MFFVIPMDALRALKTIAFAYFPSIKQDSILNDFFVISFFDPCTEKVIVSFHPFTGLGGKCKSVKHDVG